MSMLEGFMFVRAAIFLTLLFFAGAAVAGWQFQPQTACAIPGRLQEAAPQAASLLLRASLTQGTMPAEAADARYLPKPEVEALIRQGNRRMRDGDIVGARQSYMEALAYGDAAAALMMGRSYDPIYFTRIAERNAEPNPAKALRWYERAIDAGAVQTAAVRIADLKRFIGR